MRIADDPLLKDLDEWAAWLSSLEGLGYSPRSPIDLLLNGGRAGFGPRLPAGVYRLERTRHAVRRVHRALASLLDSNDQRIRLPVWALAAWATRGEQWVVDNITPPRSATGCRELRRSGLTLLRRELEIF